MSPEELAKDSSTQPSPENSARKLPVSERKIQANRQNALCSTGPKTARGKRTVARNAIRHGLLAREVLITAGEGEESQEEFYVLVERLCEDYEPVGVVEESLIQTIATCLWRKARVIRAENGEIRKRLDNVGVDRAIGNSDRYNLDLVLLDFWRTGGLFNNQRQADQKLSNKSRLAIVQELQGRVRLHPRGLEYLTVLLERAKSEMTSEGQISEAIRRQIFDAFCLWDYTFAVTIR
jgi:hypothetical protein